MNYTLDHIRKEGMIIFEAIMGSKAYGTDLPTSDTDIRGIFIQPLNDILKYGYVDQVSDLKNDIVFYELRRFMSLAESNNPNILELLNAPEECILKSTSIYDALYSSKKLFLSKVCKASFGGYAVGQIKKARGLKKKINWDENEMVRKSVLDSCYVISENKTLPFKDWILDHNSHLNEDHVRNWTHKYQKNLALTKIPHARDLYAVYDMEEYIELQGFDPFCYGVVKNEETSNDVQVKSIPKGMTPVAHLSFNKDGYSTHCKMYKEYEQWKENRNEDRYKMNKSHGKNYDSKNMMHTYRLLNMAIEIATEKEIRVRRSDEEREILMKIRRGEMDYEDLLTQAESLMEQMNQSFDESDLPNNIDQNFMRILQYDIRTNFYKQTNQL